MSQPMVARRGEAGNTWHTLTKRYPKAITPDLPGHGTRALIDEPRVEFYAETLLGLVPKNTVVIGHSFGGMVALELAVRAKDKIIALVLIETVPTVQDRLSARISSPITTELFASIPASWVAWIIGLGQSTETRVELRRQMGNMNRVRMTAVLQATAHYDGRIHLPKIDVPTLVIVGRKSQAMHHSAAIMAEKIPNAELLKLPGGHMLHTDNPVQLTRAIDDYLNKSLRVAN